MGSLSRRAAALGLLLTALVVVGGAGTASACSCASLDPVAAAASADVVFTGSLFNHVGGDTEPVWTFAVDGWVKGDVPDAELVVQGQDYGFGCGVPFAWVDSPVAVFAERRGEALVSIACSPTPGRAELARLLEEAAAVDATGTGPPAAMVVGRSGAANLRVLDAKGGLLRQADLDSEPTAAAHCAGTSLAAVWSYGPSLESGIASTTNTVSIIDLDTTEIVEQRTLESQWVSSRDDMVCLDGGERIVVGRGFGPNEGVVTSATSNRDTSLDSSRDDVGVSRALVHPVGTVTLLPSTAGGDLRTLSSDDLEPLVDVEFDASIAVTNGAFSPDGTQLAMLMTNDGNDIEDDTGATHVLVVDVADGVVVARGQEPVELESGGRGRAKWIAWFDASTWAIERETDNSKIIDAYSVDGSLTSTTDVGWGWGLLPFDGQILRARDGGVELIDRSGASTELTPMPAGPNNFSDLAIAPMIEAPLLAPDQPVIDALLLRDVDPAAQVVPATDLPADASATEPAATAAAATEPLATATAAAEPAAAEPATSEDDSTFPWPVVIIGGFVIVGGLVALRGEFRNWRQRRAARH